VLRRVEVYSSNPSTPELPLGGFMPNDDPVQIRDIQGLGPVKAEIESTPFATGRGELYQGSSTGKRNIVLNLGLNPNWINQTISSLRQLLYAYFLPQEWTKLRFFSDELPTVDIEGYVESFEPNMFSEDPEIQISVICPKPDFVDVDATLLYGIVDDGTIESVFNYVGNVATGFEFRVEQTTDNPIYTGPFTIVNKAPVLAQTLIVDPVTVNALKYFKLSTVRNAKRVMNVDSTGEITNLLSGITAASVWPELRPGENVFSIAASEPGQAWTLAYFNRFGGL
jgi:Phage tail protein